MALIVGFAVLWFVVIAWATRDTREAANDGRSIDRYSNAMRVLSRRGPARTPSMGSGRYILVPTPVVTQPVRTASSGVVERRRRALRHLVTASGVSFAGILLGGPWLVIHLVVDALLVSYVVVLRRTAARSVEAARKQRLGALARREAEHRAAYDAARRREDVVAVRAVLDEPRRAVND